MSSINALRATVTADNAGTTAGVPAIILIDGSDTAVTANGLSGYVPLSGDRVLVARVGGQVEIVQFLARNNITGQNFRTAVSGPRAELNENAAYATGTLAFYSGHPREDPDKPSRLLSIDWSSYPYDGTDTDQLQSYLALSAPGAIDASDAPVTAFLRRAFVGLFSNYNSTSGLYDSRLDLSADLIDMTATDEIDMNGAVKIGGAASGEYLLIGSNGGGTAIHELSYGLTSVSVSAAATGTQTVNHGLATTPTLLLATAYGTSTWFATTTARTSTQFDAVIRQFENTAGTVSIPVFWLAAW